MSTLIQYKATGHTRLVADFAARRLIKSGIATDANEAPAEVAPSAPPALQVYETRELEAEPVAEPVAAPRAPRNKAEKPPKTDKPKREYKTRALKSKD